MKTKPFTIRFDPDHMEFAKQELSLGSEQRVVDKLLERFWYAGNPVSERNFPIVVQESLPPPSLPKPPEPKTYPEKLKAQEKQQVKILAEPPKESYFPKKEKTVAEIEAEIKETEKELKSPPAKPLIGMAAWLKIRTDKIAELKKQLP